MKESELERRFCRLVEQAGGKAYKLVLPGGRIGFVELKRPGETPRKLQQFRRQELEGLGCYTAVVDSLECAEAVITELQRQAPVAHARDPLFEEMINRRPGRKGGVLL